MNLSYFYSPELHRGSTTIALDEDTAHHVVQVLRMQIGDRLMLTNGLGLLAEAAVTATGKKSCSVEVRGLEEKPRVGPAVSVAISPLKQAARFEWFLEKAAELGIHSITPVLCQRTERQHLREDRWKGILVSAMLQSQQAWLTELRPALPAQVFIKNDTAAKRFIAHCQEGDKRMLTFPGSSAEATILIGPEGDFTADEVEQALVAGYEAVSLGHTRLRTETAGITAAVLLTRG